MSSGSSEEGVGRLVLVASVAAGVAMPASSPLLDSRGTDNLTGLGAPSKESIDC